MDVAAYLQRIAYRQTSPQSPFTRNRLCTKVTPNGRITLDDTPLITTTNGRREERPVSSEDAFWRLTWQHFGIEPAK